MKSGNLKFPEPSGPLQAYNGTAIPLPHPSLHYILKYVIIPSNNFGKTVDVVVASSVPVKTMYCYIERNFLGATQWKVTDRNSSFTETGLQIVILLFPTAITQVIYRHYLDYLEEA